MVVRMNVEVVPVETATQRREFLSLRARLYRDDSSYVQPLGSMERMLIDQDSHPFYQHAHSQLFLARVGNTWVGRIAATKDTLQQEYDQNRLGFFGFFECTNDVNVAKALLSAATQWLRQQGCDTVRGPVNPSMKGEFGVLLEGHETSPSVMTMHNHAYYKPLLEAAGLEVIREFFAFRFVSSTAETPEVKNRWTKLARSCQRIRDRFPQIRFQTVDADNFADTMRTVNELSNRVRSAGWGYVPLTADELDFMINNLKRVIRYDMIHVAYWDDKMVGYIVNLPDVNWALKRARGGWDWLRMIQLPWLFKRIPRSRVIALGVDEAFRTKGIALLLISKLVETYDQYQEWEFSWVDSENLNSIRVIERTLPLVQSKKYQLFEKAI